MSNRYPSRGSSPLTRGKPRLGRLIPLRSGLIPAHAGKTRRSMDWVCARWAHPRSRGENEDCGEHVLAGQGSSPLTRGKPSSPPPRQRRRRLIPAHAGKTERVGLWWCGWGAHPRSRGENMSTLESSLRTRGSSPLTRGKRVQPYFEAVEVGLIPAHAGKTLFDKTHVTSRRAHPRSRGENLHRHCPRPALWGSSPLTRGKPRSVNRVRRRGGLIPAHAGKTLVCRRTSHTFAGSSPLTRGKHFLTCAFIAQIDQILESLELCAFSESYSSQDVYATDAPRDRVRSIGLAPRSSRGAS